MVSTQHIDTYIESTFTLIDVISGIGSEVGEVTIGLCDHAIFIVTEISCAQPDCTF